MVVGTWFITGTSSGISRQLTELLLERGYRVAATLRDPARLDDLAAQHGDRLWAREVTDVAGDPRKGRRGDHPHRRAGRTAASPAARF